MTLSDRRAPGGEVDLRADVISVVAAMAPWPAGTLDDNTRLVADLGYDSLRLIELTMTLEHRFALPPVDMSKTVTAGTIGDLMTLVAAELERG